ncbi:MAG: RelA/SpoT domain protein [Eubacteriales bacterium]|nr:RelA/SpoT domain protein [Eubacteriales bacterium]
MTMEEYYGASLVKLNYAEQILKKTASTYTGPRMLDGVQPILYITTRIKHPKSMVEKLERYQLATDCETALHTMHDAVGMRVICSFADDVYAVAEWLKKQEAFTVVQIKDYIAAPKPNGYRSLHLIVRMNDPALDGLSAEIQIRTIATDFWAALEHQIKYKRQVMYETVMRQELKRCADEIASLDLSMQTLRDILHGDSRENDMSA